MNMGTDRGLAIRAMAAIGLIQSQADETILGPATAPGDLPASFRRRLTPFDLGVARCLIPLQAAGASTPIIAVSRYGNMEVTLTLLTDLVANQLLSPAAFSVSVHNAAAALASQVAKNQGGHTALAAPEGGSLKAGLTEAFIRLQDGAEEALLAYADAPLPEIYAPFDEGPAGCAVFLALRLRSADEATGLPRVEVQEGRAGAAAAAYALAPAGGLLLWRP